MKDESIDIEYPHINPSSSIVYFISKQYPHSAYLSVTGCLQLITSLWSCIEASYILCNSFSNYSNDTPVFIW